MPNFASGSNTLNKLMRVVRRATEGQGGSHSACRRANQSGLEVEIALRAHQSGGALIQPGAKPFGFGESLRGIGFTPRSGCQRVFAVRGGGW